LEHTNPKQRIFINARRSVKFIFAEVDPHIGFTIQCHGEVEVELEPETDAEYLITYDFEINQSNDSYGDCYAEIKKISRAGTESLILRKNLRS